MDYEYLGLNRVGEQAEEKSNNYAKSITYYHYVFKLLNVLSEVMGL